MGGTVLKRKARRNKARAKEKNHLLRIQGFKPVIRTVDVEAIKKEFKNRPSAKAPKAKVEKVAEEVAAKAETPAKKSEPKETEYVENAPVVEAEKARKKITSVKKEEPKAIKEEATEEEAK